MVKTGLLLAAMTAIFLATGYLLGGEGGLIIAFVAALAMNGFAYWGSADMVLRMHHAREVDEKTAPEFHGLVEQLAGRAGLPMPRVFVIESDQPNAFATGRSPDHAAVAATTGILRALSREELAGVMAHELAHVKNRDTLIMTVAATIAGAIGFLSQFGLFFGMGRGEDRPNPIFAILLMILAPLAAMIVQMAISRTREYVADEEGAAICGQPRWLASALQKIEAFARGRPMASVERNPATAHLFIVNPLHSGALAGLFRTHPPTEERVARLMAMQRPSGPTPPAAKRGAPWGVRAGGSRAGTRRSGSVPSAGGRR